LSLSEFKRKYLLKFSIQYSNWRNDLSQAEVSTYLALSDIYPAFQR